jgi:hypothetical protein
MAERTLRAAAPVADSIFYDDINYLGAQMRLVVGQSLPSLNSVCIPGYCANWNDRISSLHTSYGAFNLVVFEHSDYLGSSIAVSPGATMGYLPGLGWNDRISSIRQQ